MLDAPDGHHVGVLPHKGVAGLGVVEESAGEALHGDVAHVGFAAVLHQPQLLLGGQVAEGELQGLEVPGGDGLLGDGKAVVRNADVPDVTLFLHLQGGGEGAVGVVDVRQLGGVMELEEIDIVRPQGAEALLNVGKHRLLVSAAALGGDDDVLPDPLQGLAQLFLTVGVHIRGVKVVDSAVYGPADQLHRVRLGNPLDRQSAEGCLRHHQFRASQSDFFHEVLLFIAGPGTKRPRPLSDDVMKISRKWSLGSAAAPVHHQTSRAGLTSFGYGSPSGTYSSKILLRNVKRRYRLSRTYQKSGPQLLVRASKI